MSSLRARDRERWLKSLGAAIREFRELRGMSQERLALECGLDRTYVSGIERGRRNPTMWSLARMADGLGIRVSEIVKRAESL